MRLTVILGFLAGLASPVLCGEGDEGWLRQRREERLQRPWVKKAPWLLDFDQARGEARKGARPILGYFCGSFIDCDVCDELEAGTLSDGAFPSLAKDVVLFCHVTSGSRTSRIRGFSPKGGEIFPTWSSWMRTGPSWAHAGPSSVPG